jgi:hypothetical protein
MNHKPLLYQLTLIGLPIQMLLFLYLNLLKQGAVGASFYVVLLISSVLWFAVSLVHFVLIIKNKNSVFHFIFQSCGCLLLSGATAIFAIIELI